MNFGFNGDTCCASSMEKKYGVIMVLSFSPQNLVGWLALNQAVKCRTEV